MLVAVVALLSSLMVATASAQQPSVPPNRFFGSVTLDGAPAPAGTTVEATIGGVTCGSTTVTTAGSYSRLDAVDSAATAGCGTAGATVTFLVNGNPAAETATWASGSFTDLALSAVSGAPPPAPPTAAPPTAAPATATPVIVTGTGGYLDGGSGMVWWAYTAGGLGLLLLSTAGAVAYRRLRP
jgi:hypothetical protein